MPGVEVLELRRVVEEVANQSWRTRTVLGSRKMQGRRLSTIRYVKRDSQEVSQMTQKARRPKSLQPAPLADGVGLVRPVRSGEVCIEVGARRVDEDNSDLEELIANVSHVVGSFSISLR